jgi:hypothetical protein
MALKNEDKPCSKTYTHTNINSELPMSELEILFSYSSSKKINATFFGSVITNYLD